MRISRRERMFATLCGSLAALAVLLSCIGLYGLMAYNVARRTGEIGVRLALGAQRGDIFRPILREALLLTTAGLAVGLPSYCRADTADKKSTLRCDAHRSADSRRWCHLASRGGPVRRVAPRPPGRESRPHGRAPR